MASSSSDPPLAPSPVPPDLLFLFGSSDLSSTSVPISSPSSPVPLPNHSETQSQIHPPSSDNPQSWVSLFKSASPNLMKIASPVLDEDGTPTVRAPDSITLGSSQIWKDYLIAYFHGTPPYPAKIFADLDPIWGTKGRISVKKHSSRICFIHIPSEEIRKWALEVGFWHSGNFSFTLAPWTPDAKLVPMKLTHAPVWVLFKNIPPELWSFVGFSTIASGVGFPVHSEFPKLSPYTNGISKLKVVIDLYKKRPPFVRISDRLGATVLIEALYPKLPPKCSLCNEFGHLRLRCPESLAHPLQIPPVVANPPAAITQDPFQNLQKSHSQLNPRTEESGLRQQHNHKQGSSSLPSSPSFSKENTNSVNSYRVVRRSRPRSASPSLASKTISIKPVTTAEFEEE
ncbi:unnamed protein product [Microthlaspi erraticum]|uniref:DUF4283 domain-containing protein n=1 Tax=Microthlaspi erraticum TaxID=1685480 RepID=A0A6D2KU86_9BRAS|nr:unnamed protein product [Microthlaspi erraticum]